MYQSLIVVDDFYDKPQSVRRQAIAFDYAPAGGQATFPGRNSRQKILPGHLDQVAARLTGEKLVGPKHEKSSHGRVRLTLAGEESRYLVHVDPTNLIWAGVVYLTRPEHCRGGTMFFRHLESDSDRAPLTLRELRALGLTGVGALLQRDGNDAAKWQFLMTVPMRFNRLLLYRPWLWHSAGPANRRGG